MRSQLVSPISCPGRGGTGLLHTQQQSFSERNYGKITEKIEKIKWKISPKIITQRISTPRHRGTGLHFLEPFSGKNEQHIYLNKAKMELSCPEKKSPEQDRKTLDWMNSILFISAFDEMTFLQDGSKTRSILTK